MSLDRALVERAREEVAAGRATSVSAWLNEAASRHAETEDLAAVLAGIFADTGGPPTDAEMERARKRLARARRP